MQKINIVCKSTTNIKQLQARVGICKNVELQLYDEFSNGESVETVFNRVVSIKEIDILAVHAPILFKVGLYLEYVENIEYKNLIIKTIELAHKFSEYYNHNVNVIVHSKFHAEEFDMFPELYKIVKSIVSMTSINYKNVSICLENIIPFVNEETGLHSRDGFMFDNVETVNKIRKDTNTNNVFTVLDTCHAEITLKELRSIFGGRYNYLIDGLNTDKYFELNAPVCKILHLSDTLNLGYAPFEHGIAFTDDRLYEMERFINLYIKHSMFADITLEIQEINYENPVNLMNNYIDLKNLLKSNGLEVG